MTAQRKKYRYASSTPGAVISFAFAIDGDQTHLATSSLSQHVHAQQTAPLSRSLDDFLNEYEPIVGEEVLKQERQELGAFLNKNAPSLRSLRLLAGLTQMELAKKISSSQSYVQRLESGQIKNPKSTRVRQLAQALSVSESDILSSIDK